MGSYIWSSSVRLRTKQKHEGIRCLGEWRLHSPTWLVSRVSWPPSLGVTCFVPSFWASTCHRSPGSSSQQPHSVPVLWDPRGGESKLLTWKQEPPRRGWMRPKSNGLCSQVLKAFQHLMQVFSVIWCWIILCYGRGWSPVCCMVFSSLPDLYQLDAQSSSSVVTNKIISRHWQCSCGEQSCPQLITNDLESTVVTT